MDGVILINKPKGITSRDVVNEVCKILKTKKVGHTGTLDPIASGVLVVCVGKATKLVDIITSANKEYVATVKLGLLTDTLDLDGKVIKKEKVTIRKEELINVLNSFLGKYEQEVPIYSAVKVNGKKLYVATSKPEFFAKQIIEHFSLSKYFEYVGGSEFNSREKKAEVIEYVLKTNQIDNDDVIMVGDRKHDIIGAHENKIPCVGVLYGYGTEDELKQYQADYLVSTVEELTELLK